MIPTDHDSRVDDGDDFPNKPQPEDWGLPDYVKDKIDDIGVALLSEHDREGVPIPLLFQFSGEVGEWVRRLDSGEAIQPVLDDINNSFDDKQSRYPGAAPWDRLLDFLAKKLVEQGHEEDAIELSWRIASPHTLVRTLTDIMEASESDHFQDISQDIVHGLEPEHRAAVLVAFRDYIIEYNPSSGTLEHFNNILTAYGIETDHLSGWVESQRKLHPDWSWDFVLETVKNEAVWADVPMAMRQSLMLIYLETAQEIVNGEMGDDSGSELQVFIDALEDKYPGADIWSHIRGHFSVFLLQRRPQDALNLARSIRDPRLMNSMVLKFIEEGHEPEAIELATVITDISFTAELLLDADWKDAEAAVSRLADIIESDEYPSDRRITCMEVVRDRMIATNDLARAVEYQDMIDELKRG